MILTAVTVLKIINDPAAMELHTSVALLEAKIESLGFKKESSDLVTMGWAPYKVGKGFASSAIIQIGDQIILVGSGSSGNYYVDVLVPDISDGLSSSQIECIQQNINLDNPVIGPKASKLISSSRLRSDSTFRETRQNVNTLISGDI